MNKLTTKLRDGVVLNKKSTGSAYIFILITMMTLFLLITAAIGLTTSARRISGYYIHFASLYDLSVAGNERALIILNDKVQDNSEDMTRRILNRLYEQGIESYLTFHEGDFLLEGFMTDFREEKNILLIDFLESFNLTHLSGHFWRYFSYSLNLATGTYEIRTNLRQNSGRYVTHSSSIKIINDLPGPAATVRGQIYWPTFDHHAEIIPTAYTWRYEEPPAMFGTGNYSFAGQPSIFDFSTMPETHLWNAENALLITDFPYINVFGFAGTPSIILFPNPAPLTIYGSVQFEGIIISAGDIYIEGNVRGSVIAGGTISMSPGFQTIHDPDILFSIPLEEEMRRNVFDFLRLTDFDGASETVTDISELLGYVKIADFDFYIEPLNSFVPRLTGIQYVAN